MGIFCNYIENGNDNIMKNWEKIYKKKILNKIIFFQYR